MNKFSKWLAAEYLDLVTVCWFNHNEVPADHVEDYDEFIEQIRIRATGLGEMEELRLVLERILSDPTFNFEVIYGGGYPFDSDEIRAIAVHIYKKLWPNIPFSSISLSGMSLVEQTWDEWNRQRDEWKKQLVVNRGHSPT